MKARLDQLVKGQTEMIEYLSSGRPLPPTYRIAQLARGGLQAVRPSLEQDRTLRVDGEVPTASDGSTLWVGAYAAGQFWPLVRLPARPRDRFSYRLHLPENFSSGQVLLVAAGPEPDRQFDDVRTSSAPNVGVFLPHMTNVVVLGSANVSSLSED